jgi:hypothetical protein
LTLYSVNGKAAGYTQAHGSVAVAVEAPGKAVDITIAYSGIFDDQAPAEPLNTDNPGYGVTGTIGDQGTMLLAGAGWYPDAEGLEDRYTLVVDAPEGTVAVTSGTPGAVVSEGGRTLSHWSTGIAHRGLPLVAGPYSVSRRSFGNVTAATYFTAELQHLSDAYLASTGRYLQLYTSLFGPYPHEQFAVVENFFPTGYGFSSFTLMGRRVLALPFIRHTSLGHEIAHCWWGNGVLVDASQGNWSEALTTYVADYLFKERSGDGRAHRRQWLRNYASLVPPSRDIPLSRFMQRIDPVTRVVGYEKGAMVFHMLRQSLGDDIFWTALRDVAHRYRFKHLAWSDLQSAFEAHSGRSLGPYFDQWLFRPGAPAISLADVTAASSSGGVLVSGAIQQEGTAYAFDLVLELRTADGIVRKTIPIKGGRTPFTLQASGRPLSLAADPDIHLFRRLDPLEVPPSINSLKGIVGLHVAVARDLGEHGMVMARRLVTGLGLRRAVVDFEDQFPPGRLAEADLLLVGKPADLRLIPGDPDSLRINTDGVALTGTDQLIPGDSFFGVFTHPAQPERLAALYLPGQTAAEPAVSTKIPHYGKYSYVVFDGSRNRAKGTWEAGPSPLEFHWAQPKRSENEEI